MFDFNELINYEKFSLGIPYDTNKYSKEIINELVPMLGFDDIALPTLFNANTMVFSSFTHDAFKKETIKALAEYFYDIKVPFQILIFTNEGFQSVRNIRIHQLTHGESYCVDDRTMISTHHMKAITEIEIESTKKFMDHLVLISKV